MRVPILGSSNVPTVCELLLSGQDSQVVDDHLEFVGDGLDLDLDVLADGVDELRAHHERAADSSTDQDRLEGQFGAKLHALLTEMRVDELALDTPGFWAYLGTRHLWWFVTWRHPGSFGSGAYSNYRRYVDGVNPSECVALRAYLRAKIVCDFADEDPYRLVAAVPRGADFWRSHVLRVRTGTSSALTRAFISRQVEDRMGTEELRGFARQLNRQWSNLVLHIYDEADARKLIDDIAEGRKPS